MIIDIHCHLYQPEWYPSVFSAYLASDYLRKTGVNPSEDRTSKITKTIHKMLSDHDGETTLRIMDKLGIEKRYIHIIDWGLALGEPTKNIREIHRHVLEICSKYPDRLCGFAGLDPTRPDATEILEWAFDSLGAEGLKLHPTSTTWKLMDDNVSRLVEITQQRQRPIMVHCGKTINLLSSINCGPESILHFAEMHPDINIIAAHCGYDLWSEFSTRIPGNLYFDISGWQEILSKNPSGFHQQIRELLSQFRGHVFYGTDNPFCGFNVSESEKRWIECLKLALGDEDSHMNPEFFCCNLF